MGMLPGRAGPAAGPAMGGLPIEWEQQGDGLMINGQWWGFFCYVKFSPWFSPLKFFCCKRIDYKSILYEK